MNNSSKKILSRIFLYFIGLLIITFIIFVVYVLLTLKNSNLFERDYSYPVYHFTFNGRVERVREAFVNLERKLSIVDHEDVDVNNYYYYVIIIDDNNSIEYCIYFEDCILFKKYIQQKERDSCNYAELHIESIRIGYKYFDNHTSKIKQDLKEYQYYIDLFKEKIYNPLVTEYKKLPDLDYGISKKLISDKENYVIDVFEKNDSSKIIAKYFYLKNIYSDSIIFKYNPYKIMEFFGDSSFMYLYDSTFYVIDKKYLISNGDTSILYDFDTENLSPRSFEVVNQK